jgi:hypothetical protein
MSLGRLQPRASERIFTHAALIWHRMRSRCSVLYMWVHSLLLRYVYGGQVARNRASDMRAADLDLLCVREKLAGYRMVYMVWESESSRDFAFDQVFCLIWATAGRDQDLLKIGFLALFE